MEGMESLKGIVKLRSKTTFGIQMEGSETWFNLKSASDADKKRIQDAIQTLQSGSEIELFVWPGENKYADYTVLKEPERKEGTDDRNIVGLKELLNAAHAKGLVAIHTEIVKIDYEKKMAHVKAYAWAGKEESTHCFHGSACKSASDMTEQQKKYWLETVESQAIARALRWLSNTGDVSDIEVHEEEKADVKEEEKSD